MGTKCLFERWSQEARVKHKEVGQEGEDSQKRVH